MAEKIEAALPGQSFLNMNFRILNRHMKSGRMMSFLLQDRRMKIFRNMNYRILNRHMKSGLS